MTLDGDTESIDKLIQDLPTLEYSGEKPEIHREKSNRVKDDFDMGDGLKEKEEDGAELSIWAQLIATFKTIEILGQLLKNRYASLSRSAREDAMEKLFDGPLRGLRAYVDLLTEYPDALIAEVDAGLAEKGGMAEPEKRRRAARELSAFFVQLSVLGFFSKAASSVSSDALIEDVQAVVKKRGSMAFKLMEVAVLLDGPGAIPQSKIQGMIEDVKGKILPTKMLQFLVLQRLYVFKSTEKEKQWLASKDVVALRTQQAIEIKTGRSRKVR